MITNKPYLTKLNELIEIDENPKWLEKKPCMILNPSCSRNSFIQRVLHAYQ